MTAEEILVKHMKIAENDDLEYKHITGHKRILSAMQEYAAQEAEKARREERERIEKEIKCYRTTLSDIAGMDAESRVSGGDYRNTLLHIQADASWALSEYDKNETEGK